MRIKKQIGQSRAARVARRVLLFLAVAIVAFPLLVTFFTAFKPTAELFSIPQRILPEQFSTENFINLQVSGSYPFSRIVFNSIFVSIITAAVEAAICVCAGYALATGRTWLCRAVNVMVEMSLIFSGGVLICAVSYVGRMVHSYDSYSAMILPFVASGLGVVLMREYIKSLPQEILWAADLDSAGVFTKCFRITLPSLKPAISAVAAVSFINSWIRSSTLFSYSPKYETITMYIDRLGRYDMESIGIISAAYLIMLLPVTIVFFAGQESIGQLFSHAKLKASIDELDEYE